MNYGFVLILRMFYVNFILIYLNTQSSIDTHILMKLLGKRLMISILDLRLPLVTDRKDGDNCA